MVQTHHHHPQQAITSQQQIVSTVGQQHPVGIDSRLQQQQSHQHQQALMMGQSGMMQQGHSSQHQQQQQMQQQMYQQPLVGLTTASIPIGSSGAGLNQQGPYAKRAKLYPEERVLLYTRQADEKDFYPLHITPPTLPGLIYAIEQKYKVDSNKVLNIYKKTKKGGDVKVHLDDDMIRLYCNEDLVQLDVEEHDNGIDITLVEL